MTRKTLITGGDGYLGTRIARRAASQMPDRKAIIIIKP